MPQRVRILHKPVISQSFLGPLHIVTADLNGDGAPDLAMQAENQVTASILITKPTQTATATGSTARCRHTQCRSKLRRGR